MIIPSEPKNRKSELKNLIGKSFTVIIDRPIHSNHPKHPGIKYQMNYGYIKSIIAADGENLDAYIIGVDFPIETFTGICIGYIHRKNDIEDKLLIAEKSDYSEEKIKEITNFQEKYFDIEIVLG